MQTYHCSVCGKPVEKFPCHVRDTCRVYCSDKCRRTPFIPIECEECGDTFLVAGQQSGQAKFCSRDCRNAYKRREQVHKKGKQVTKHCERCGKPFRVRPSVARVQRYCSQKCSGATIGEAHRGENSPTWKGKVAIVCDYCGKEFLTFPSRKNRRKYCCQKHRVLGNLKRLAAGERTNLEATMAKALRRNGLAYDEQVIMFDKFMVDFKLREHPIIIQCDGIYWHDRPKVRARDKGQDRYLAKAGYIVLRFSDKQILDHVFGCIQRVKHTIATGQIPLINW